MEFVFFFFFFNLLSYLAVFVEELTTHFGIWKRFDLQVPFSSQILSFYVELSLSLLVFWFGLSLSLSALVYNDCDPFSEFLGLFL